MVSPHPTLAATFSLREKGNNEQSWFIHSIFGAFHDPLAQEHRRDGRLRPRLPARGRGGLDQAQHQREPLSPLAAVREAILAEVGADGANLRKYPDAASSEMRRVAAELYGFDPSWVITANGSDELLNNLIRAFAGEGEEVAYVHPSYSYYATLAEIQGAKIRTFGLTDDFKLADFPSATRGRSSFSPAPTRPSVSPFPSTTSRRSPQRCAGMLVVDEAYVDFADGTRPGAGEKIRERRRHPHLLQELRPGRDAPRPRRRPPRGDRGPRQDPRPLPPRPPGAGRGERRPRRPGLSRRDGGAHPRHPRPVRRRAARPRLPRSSTRRPTSSSPLPPTATASASTRRSSPARSWCATSPTRFSSTACASPSAPRRRWRGLLAALREIG